MQVAKSGPRPPHPRTAAPCPYAPHALRPMPPAHGRAHVPHSVRACAATLEPRAERLGAHKLSFGMSCPAAQFSPDGSMIASAGVDGSIKVWRAGPSRGGETGG